jgi:hypothetical protein
VPVETCTWTLDEDYYSWFTACGEGFTFTDGGPAANSFRFCPYCGRPIVGDAL